MIAKTKRYAFDPKIYRKIALVNLLKAQWWYAALPVIIGALAFVWPSYKWWFISLFILIPSLYILFWYIQFYGATQLEQGKIWFQKLSYEIDNKQILIKLDARQGMPMPWENIKKIEKREDYYLLVINKAQMIYLPFKMFLSDNDLRFFESVLKRKNLVA
jgi:hypothetical protein